MQSPIYWHPFFYRCAMKLVYGNRFISRYANLQKHIPENSNVLELCMGDAFFYLNFLKQKNINYKCADINEVFVRSAKGKNIDAGLINIYTDEIPNCDHILLQGSLCYFIPNQKQIIQKLLKACNKELIISENIENLSNSKSFFKSFIAEKLSASKFGQSKIKFTKESLIETFSGFKPYIKVWEESPGNKEIIIVLKKS